MQTKSPDDGYFILIISVIGAVGSLAIAMGIGRFAYSALLPAMLSANIVGRDQAAILAASNYAGYLLGSFAGMISLNDREKKFLLFACMILSVLTTWAMSIITDYEGMVALRFLSGIASACVFVFTSFLILRTIYRYNKPYLTGVIYSGVGIGMLISSASIILFSSHPPQWHWAIIGLLCTILFIPATYWLRFAESTMKQTPPIQQIDPTAITPFLVFLTSAYFLEGLGYIINGTFLVAWVDSNGYLSASSQTIWIIVALAAIPSCLLWTRLAHRFHFLRTLIAAYLVQSIGILLTTLDDYVAILVGSALFGGTFMGITALTISAAKIAATVSSTTVISMLTLFYGIGQSLGPLLSTIYVDSTESYYSIILTSSFLVFAAAVLLIGAHTFKSREAFIK